MFDKSGRSQYKVRCAFDAEKAAVGYGFEDTSSLFTLEGRPRTAKRPKTRTSSRRTRRVSELTDDELHPAGDALAASCGHLSIIFIGNAAAIEAAVGPIVAKVERRDAARAAVDGDPAGVARLARLGGGPRRRGRAAAARNVTTGARGHVAGRRRKEGGGLRHRGQRRRVPQEAARAAGAVVDNLRPRGVGNDLKRRATTVEKRRETDAGWRAENQAAKILEGTGAADASEGTSTGPRVWRLP